MNRAARKSTARLGGWLALLAVVALILQIATPAFSHAAGVERHDLQICTQDGLRTISVETPAEPADHRDCAKCPACLQSASAALPAPQPCRLVAHLASAQGHGLAPAPAQAFTRPPPRPFGQGPPHFLEA